MVYPIKLIDVDLNSPLHSITGLEGYKGVQIILRLHERPLCHITVAVTNGCVDVEVLHRLILDKYTNTIFRIALQNALNHHTQNTEFCPEDLFNIKPSVMVKNLPLVTVAVCTRNRANDLALCLAAISELEYTNLEVVVIDNAPGNDDTEQLVKKKFPQFRYVRELRPGLDWARNRAILESRGEIIAYTDDDVMVDKRWVNELAVLFVENPEVMAVTGLVVPYEMETKSQVLFEMYGGFGRGFERKWFRKDGKNLPWTYLGAGQFGTGANMAYRRSIFEEIGYFDPALDVGTVTNGGGDLEMFFRILKEGHTLVYEPAAFVRHRHRRNYNELRNQITNNSKGFLSYCARSLHAYPDERSSFYKLWSWWIRKWILRRLIKSYIKKSGVPRDLIIAEIQGAFKSRSLYSKARKSSNEIQKQFKSEPAMKSDYPQLTQKSVNVSEKPGTAIRLININEPIGALTDITDYAKIRLFVKWGKWLLGYADIHNHYQPLSRGRVIQSIVQSHGFKLEKPFYDNENVLSRHTFDSLQKLYSIFVKSKACPEELSPKITVSVVVATYDRPEDLRNCLRHLVKQISPRQIQIIVVDNNPSSGLTSPVVNEFKEVILVNETRKGLSYARNTGINYSTGHIILSTDDDVTVPPDWVENIVTPFAKEDVMAVTGNVLPIEMEGEAQHLFEKYGGLGRGFKRVEANKKWFESFKRKAVPTWKLGACANAAFRADIFKHPEIGIFKETLGAGTPTGCSEDSYLMYKILKANYTIVYEPASFVWHKHRQNISSFRKQLYNYSKGHVAHHILTLINDRDLRGLYRIMVELPVTNINRIKKSLMGKSNYPVSMILLEIAGNFAGPWALLRSWFRVKKQGRSAPYNGPAGKTSAKSKNLLEPSKEII
ncbi:MAG: glycosyltransferase family 2 protein [Ginsengibacter sp.]